jgi:hypothetical protein
MKVTIGNAQGWSVNEAKIDLGKRNQAIASAEMAYKMGRKKPSLRPVEPEYQEFCLEYFASLG